MIGGASVEGRQMVNLWGKGSGVLGILTLAAARAHNVPDLPRRTDFIDIPMIGDRSLLTLLERAWALLPPEDQVYVARTNRAGLRW